jgi:MFS family permease
MTGWALLADVVPLYPLYALLFADAGLSGAQISLLFTIWSVVGMVAEVPSGVLADRFSRRSSLVVGAVLQATAYAAWTARPDFAGFAAGFALWGVGGSFVSGASEALLYEGLAEHQAADRFPAMLARLTSVSLLAQVPAAVAASFLYRSGGYPLVGWASVASCLATAVVARLIPEERRAGTGSDKLSGRDAEAEADEVRGALRTALTEVRVRPLVRAGVLAVAAVAGLDAIEEYVPLLAERWSVPVAAIPLIGLGLPLAGALGASMAGRSAGPAPDGRKLGLRLGLGGLLLLGATLVHVPLALLPVFVFYALYQSVLVAAGARLQQRIAGRARATVTSLAALAGELTALATYAAWALGAGAGVAVLVLAVAAGLPRWLGRDR